jgi:hypothetical protein
MDIFSDYSSSEGSKKLLKLLSVLKERLAREDVREDSAFTMFNPTSNQLTTPVLVVPGPGTRDVTFAPGVCSVSSHNRGLYFHQCLFCCLTDLFI